MKKKTAHKATAAKASRPVKTERVNLTKPLLILAAALLILFMIPATKLPLANLLAQTGLFHGSAPVTWPAVKGAVSYNIYYKRVGSISGDNFSFAVRNIPASATSYTITGLKRGKSYEYKVSAVNAAGEEYLWTSLEKTPDAM
jgi:hypothetical protein